MPDPSIIDEIREAINNIDYGSVEVIVQEGQVTQISTKIIKKTNVKTAHKHTHGDSIRKPNSTGIRVDFKY